MACKAALPTPCNTRQAMSIHTLTAIPDSNEAATKVTSPATNNRRRPSASAARPRGRSKLVITSKYASTTHCSASNVASSSTASVGSARLTALESSVAMNTLVMTTASVAHLCEWGFRFKPRPGSAERMCKLHQRAREPLRVVR